MRVPIYQIDAFTTERFRGNPAAVMPLEAVLSEPVMQLVARENNLSDTAFLVRNANGWDIRWFTPRAEVPLCGHATLASAWVIRNRLEPGRDEMTFYSKSGKLSVRTSGDRYAMDFPSRRIAPHPRSPELTAALGATPVEVLADARNLVAVMDSARTVRELAPDISAIARLQGTIGVIVTARGDDEFDCVTRYFTPQQGVDEDPVTGSAHCAVAPYWSAKLGKQELRAYQASARGGELICRVNGDRVELEGSCSFYMEGVCEV
jgi:PhzF family phenazine biosynthesis protein